MADNSALETRKQALPAPAEPAALPITRGQRSSPRGSQLGAFLTREEMAAIARAARSERDRLMLRCLAETGARISELLTLTPHRIGRGFVLLPVLKRRGETEKAVYLNPASHLLLDLLSYSNEQRMGPFDRFFPITRKRAYQVVTAAAELAGVFRMKEGRRVPAWPHLFRHGAATAMLEDSDDDAVFVQAQLGHKRIDQTLQYAALSEAKRREKAARLRIAPETWGR